MSKQRLSHDEKKKRFLDYFHETRDFWQLKELEKNVPKSKGIVSQSIKDVLQELCSDNLVSMDKIGTSNYYWSFPSDTAKNASSENTSLTKQVADLNKLLESSIATFDSLQADGYQDTLERQELVDEFLKLTNGVKEREEALHTARKSGSAALDEKRKYIALAKVQVESYTDGTISALSKLAEVCDAGESALRQQFDISEDYEDVIE